MQDHRTRPSGGPPSAKANGRRAARVKSEQHRTLDHVVRYTRARRAMPRLPNTSGFGFGSGVATPTRVAPQSWIANGTRRLWWSYLSLAHSLEQKGNPPHRGGAELVSSEKPTLSLACDYWTERKTNGRLTTHGRNKHCYDDFPRAIEATYA